MLKVHRRQPAVLLVIATLALVDPAGAENGFSATAEFGFSAASGNTDKLDLLSRNRVAHVSDHATLAFATSVRYGEVKDVKNTQELTGAFNYDYYPWKHWSVFAFATALNNPFRDIRTRALGAGGGKWTPFIGEKGSASLSLAAIREYDQFKSDRTEERRFRYSWRFKGDLNLPNKGKLTHTTFLVQDFETPFDEYRVESDTSLSAPICGWLHLKTSLEYNYENRPRPGVGRTDRLISTALVLNWI